MEHTAHFFRGNNFAARIRRDTVPLRDYRKPLKIDQSCEDMQPGGFAVNIEKPIKANYRPSPKEPFMCDRQKEYFRKKLLDWKTSILEDSRETVNGMQEETRNIPDIADRASEETDRALLLRTRDRERKLIAKIDAALQRLDKDEYGYCEATGEPISLRRLDARPIATLSLEAQERHERKEKIHRDL